MISPEKESVDFTKKIDVNEGDKKGNVEKWLLEIEHEMRFSLKEISKVALADSRPRTEWVIYYQAMIVLMGDMIRWTKSTEDALTEANKHPDSIKKLHESLKSDLSDIVNLVRGELNELDRLTLSALVTV